MWKTALRFTFDIASGATIAHNCCVCAREHGATSWTHPEQHLLLKIQEHERWWITPAAILVSIHEHFIDMVRKIWGHNNSQNMWNNLEEARKKKEDMKKLKSFSWLCRSPSQSQKLCFKSKFIHPPIHLLYYPGQPSELVEPDFPLTTSCSSRRIRRCYRPAVLGLSQRYHDRPVPL